MPARATSSRFFLVAAALALTACGGGGGSKASPPRVERVTGVAAVAGDGEVTVSWDPFPGALSYNLYWSKTPGVDAATGNLLQDVTSPQVLTATNGVTYYVVVTAVTAAGESAESAEAWFTPGASPVPPGTGHVGVVTTIAGSSMDYADGDAIHARFNTPTGIVGVGTSLYVCDTTNMLIRRLDLSTRQVTTLAGDPRTYAGHQDGIGTAASFNSPRGITSDGTYLYVADTANNLVRRIDLATAAVTTLAGSTTQAGAADGPGASATFRWPRGVATDGTTLYVADTMNNAIRALDLATGVVSTLAGDPASYAGYADGRGTAARFSAPYGLAMHGGELLVADSGNSAIRAVDPLTGEVTTVSTTTAAPYAIAVIGGYVYVANHASGGGDPVPGTGNTITEIDLATGEAWTLAGGNWYATLADGTGTAAAINYPEGMTGLDGKLYVSDTFSHVLRRIDLQPL